MAFGKKTALAPSRPAVTAPARPSLTSVGRGTRADTEDPRLEMAAESKPAAMRSEERITRVLDRSDENLGDGDELD